MERLKAFVSNLSLKIAYRTLHPSNDFLHSRIVGYRAKISTPSLFTVFREVL